MIAETLEVRENFKQLKAKYEAQKSKSVEFLISVHQVRKAKIENLQALCYSFPNSIILSCVEN